LVCPTLWHNWGDAAEPLRPGIVGDLAGIPAALTALIELMLGSA